MNILMEIREGMGISWAAIRANKMRSVLTTIGIVIGIVTVTLMGTAIEGLDKAFLKSISIIGTDVLYVSRMSWFVDSREEWERMQKRRPIHMDQVKELENRLTMARAVAPEVEFSASVGYRRRHANGVRIIGTTEAMQRAGSVAVTSGRFFSMAESAGGRPVCVIGSEVATNLFAAVSPLGERVRVGQATFEVVGVLEKKGSFLGMMSLDNQIMIPTRQFAAEFWSTPDYTVQVKVADLAHIEDAKEELRAVLRSIRHLAPGEPDDFAINQQDQFVKMFNRLGGTIAAVGLFITGLSLFVGGIGIMNIMFVSVAERTREIGIRKAIGAKRRTILIQFLIEAATICLLGGAIALLLAFVLTLVVQRFIPATMSPRIVGIGLLVAGVTGVLSGFLPAWRAARMNPVDALRNE